MDAVGSSYKGAGSVKSAPLAITTGGTTPDKNVPTASQKSIQGVANSPPMHLMMLKTMVVARRSRGPVLSGHLINYFWSTPTPTTSKIFHIEF